MALSLDDLKKKKPSVTKRVSLDAEIATPQRKKLSPWQSIEQKEQALLKNDEKPVTELSSEKPIEYHPIEVTTVETGTLDTATLETITKDQTKTTDLIITLDPPLIDNQVKKKTDVSTTTEDKTVTRSDMDDCSASTTKVNLNAQKSPLEPSYTTEGNDMDNFKFEAISEVIIEKEHRSDTEVTQKKHRSDTKVSTNDTKKSAHKFVSDQKEVTQKKHRSDTNKAHSSSAEISRCDTEVTHKYDLDLVNLFNGDISDTEVTQFEEKTRRSTFDRSDTDLTQTTRFQTQDNLFQKALPFNSEKQRSDTDLTQYQASTYFYANSPEDLTQKKHRSDTEVTPYKTQKRHKEVTQILSTSDAQIHEKRIHVLRGNQLNLFNFICESLLNTGENIMQTSYEYLAHQTRINIGSIKTTAKRLRDSELLDINAFGGGKGACIQVIVTDLVLKIFARKFKTRSNTEVTQNQSEKRHRSDTIPDTNAPSKLVSNLNNNLLPSVPVPLAVSEPNDSLDVSAINVDPLARFNIYRKQIQDIKNQKLNFTTAALQEFIDRFVIYASDSKNVRNVMSLPAIFVRMAQLASKGQDPLIDIETETDRIIRERLEQLMQKKQERLNRQNQLLELEFEAWIDDLHQGGRDQLVPPTAMMKSGSVAQTMTLKNYFVEKIWPARSAELGL